MLYELYSVLMSYFALWLTHYALYKCLNWYRIIWIENWVENWIENWIDLKSWNWIKSWDTQRFTSPMPRGFFFCLCMFYIVHVWEVMCKTTLTKTCSCSWHILHVQYMIQQRRTVRRLRWPPAPASLSTPGCSALSLLIPSVSLSSAVFCSSHE